jgi:gliding motility-associated-like protein
LFIAISPSGFRDTLSILINDHIFRLTTSQDSFTQCSNEPFELPVTLVSRAILTSTPADMLRLDPVTQKYMVQPIRTGKLYISGRLDNCVERDSIYITSIPIGVNLNTRDTAFLCFPDSIRLIASPTPSNGTIQWTLDNQSRLINNSTIQVRPIQSRNYIVQVTSAQCKASDTVHVRIDSLRETKINVFPKKDQYCKGDSLFFFSQRHPKDLFPFIKPSWNPSNGFQTPADTFNAVLMADVTTTYYRLTQNNACRQTDSIFIKVVEPSIPVGPVDTTVCPGTTVQINFNQDGAEYKDFKWTPQDGLISCEKCADPKIKVNGTQMYKVEAKKDGCDASSEIKTQVFTRPPVRIATDLPAPIIAGSNVRVSLLGTDGFQAVKWSIDGNMVPAGTLVTTINAIKAGSHPVEVEVTDRNGCMWSYSFLILAECPPRSVQLNRVPAANVYEGTTINFSVAGAPNNLRNIRWTRNGNNLAGTGLTNQDKPTSAGNYTYRFEAVDANDCPVTAVNNVIVIACISADELKRKIPNAFTPNGDQKNDYFNYSEGGLQIVKLLVFSRWGQLVYNNTDPTNGWDGKFNGTDAPSEQYLYRITYICGDSSPQEVSGTVLLLR